MEHGATLLYIGGQESERVSVIHKAFRSRGPDRIIAKWLGNEGILGVPCVVSTPGVVDVHRTNGVPSITEACSASTQGTMGSMDVMGVLRGMGSRCGVLAVVAKCEGMSTQIV